MTDNRQPPKAEIIAIGTELTSGQKLDTNSQWLSLELAELGIEVHWHTTVADDMAENVQALRIAADRADLVLITGGLGPTLDDLTRDALAQLAGVELVLHEPSLEFIERFFKQRGREMPERNRVQALFPVGAEPLVNPIGTAPGIWLEVPVGGRGWTDRSEGSPGARGASPSHPDPPPLKKGEGDRTCRIAAMPGVPAEMHRMFHEQVRPRLAGGGKVIRRALLNCFGLGESHTEQILGELTARGRDPEIGITAHEATITLRIIATGDSETECQAKIAAASAEIRKRLGHYVFSEGQGSLEGAVLQLLADRNATLATVEAGTGGLLATALARSQPAQRYLGGIIASASGARQSLLEANEDPFAAETAQRMAVRCREHFSSTYAIAVGWFPPVDTSTIAADAPHAYVALATPEGVSVEQINLWGSPAILHSRVAKAAINLLRLKLMGASGVAATI
jgi:nicotinamide-nucleotide amidase